MSIFSKSSYFTIKRINKGLKPFQRLKASLSYFTIKRINKGLKLGVAIFVD